MVGPVTALGCDTHLHFYDERYPTSPDAVLKPPDATPDDYRAVQEELGLERLVVVQPTTYGLDNRCQLAALADFGEQARGVMVVDSATDNAELRRLHELGVRGARFHMLPGGAVGWHELEPVAAAIVDFGWHIQLQCNGRELAARYDQLAALPTSLVIDHVGRFMPPVDVEDENFVALMRLVQHGSTWVKLSAPYESSERPISNHPTSAENHSDVLPLIDELVTTAPGRLLWASNWPHPGQDMAPAPITLANQAHRWLPSEALRDQVLCHNADEVYFRS